MLDENNLNLITRLELLDTFNVLPSGSVSGQQIAELLNGLPSQSATQPDNDVFEILFDRPTLEVIAFAVEQYAYERAEAYAASVEEGQNKEADDRSFFYWQALSERWGYLEIMR